MAVPMPNLRLPSRDRLINESRVQLRSRAPSRLVDPTRTRAISCGQPGRRGESVLCDLAWWQNKRRAGNLRSAAEGVARRAEPNGDCCAHSWNPRSGGSVEVSMRRLAWCLFLVPLVAACGSSSHVSTPGSTSTTRGSANTTSTSVRIPSTRVLRGIPVRSFECPPRPLSSAVSPIPVDAVQTLMLCPLSMPGLSSNAVTVGVDRPIFKVLIAALSAADEPPTRGVACPLYADLPQVVVAKTSGSVYQVSIPTDACKHYRARRPRRAEPRSGNLIAPIRRRPNCHRYALADALGIGHSDSLSAIGCQAIRC